MDSDVLTDLEIIIDKYVRSLLRGALGNILFKDLDSNIANGVLKDTAPDKWKNLVNGVEYTKDEVVYNWPGLIQTEGTFKNSILAKFVYFYWLKDSVSLLTGTGEKNITAEGAIGSNSTQKLVTVWNSFIEDYQPNYEGGYHQQFMTRYSYYPYPSDLPIFDCLANNADTGIVSLIQFLTDSETDYPDAALTMYEPMNQLGL